MFLKSLKKFSITFFLVVGLSLFSRGSYAALTFFSGAIIPAIAWVTATLEHGGANYFFDKETGHKCKKAARSLCNAAATGGAYAGAFCVFAASSYVLEDQDLNEYTKGGLSTVLGVTGGFIVSTALSKIANCGLRAGDCASDPRSQYGRQSDDSLRLNNASNKENL